MMEARREKEIAEWKMIQKDYASAREHLIAAKRLLPAIPNIDSMITACSILTAADASAELPCSEIDYYWILQVFPSCSLSDIECNYQKRFTLLQHIRKDFPGLESALGHLKDAYSVLSDREKRRIFNSKRGRCWENYESSDVQASPCHDISKAQSSLVCSSTKTGYVSSKSARIPKDVATPAARRVTFQCSNAHKNVEKLNPFSADLNCGQNAEADMDENVDSTNLPITLQPISPEGIFSCSSEQRRLLQDFYNFEKDRKSEQVDTGQIWAVNYRTNLDEKGHKYLYARIESKSNAVPYVTWLKPIPVSAGERRWYDAGLLVACGSFEVDLDMQERKAVGWPMILSSRCSWARGVTEQQFEIYPKRGEIWAVYKNWNLDDWSYNLQSMEGCEFELVEIISDFSKYLGTYGACLAKVEGFNSIFKRQTTGGNLVTLHIPPNNLYNFSHKIPAYRFEGGELDKVIDGMFELDQLALPDYMIQDTGTLKAQKRNTASTFAGQLPTSKPHPDEEVLMPSWSPDDFATGQVWALCWGNDLMPRRYARINNVVSENQVCITFLEPLPIIDHQVELIRENCPAACGMFKVGEKITNVKMSRLSHQVQYQERASKSLYLIYPLKGQIWAMFKGWNKKWKTYDYENCQCQVVQIVSDFSEGDWIRVVSLREVKGCLTFFYMEKYDGSDRIHTESRAGLGRFSHQIPAARMPGIGKYGILENAWHLEPNALPSKS